MSKNYPSATVYSFAILLAIALWGTTGILEALTHHESFSSATVMFSVLVALAFISADCTLRNKKWAFVLATIVTIVADIGIVVSPTGPFTRPVELYTVSFILYYIISTVGLYFYYKGYRSLAPPK